MFPLFYFFYSVSIFDRGSPLTCNIYAVNGFVDCACHLYGDGFSFFLTVDRRVGCDSLCTLLEMQLCAPMRVPPSVFDDERRVLSGEPSINKQTRQKRSKDTTEVTVVQVR